MTRQVKHIRHSKYGRVFYAGSEGNRNSVRKSIEGSFRIAKFGTLDSGIEIPRYMTFDSESQAYRYGLGRWGSGSYRVNGGWQVVED